MKKMFGAIGYAWFVFKKKIAYLRNKKQKKTYDPFIY